MAKPQTIRQERSNTKNTVRLGLRFTKSTDKDILDRLEEVGEGKKQAYIKELIREDIERRKN